MPCGIWLKNAEPSAHLKTIIRKQKIFSARIEIREKRAIKSAEKFSIEADYQIKRYASGADNKSCVAKFSVAIKLLISAAF